MKARATAGWLATAGAIGVVAWVALVRPDSDWNLPPEDERDRSSAVAAATARIAGEARRGVPPPRIEAAPRQRVVADPRRRQDRRTPNPPQGYAFVRHDGAMTGGRIEAPDEGDEGPTVATVPAWLIPDAGVPALTEQAAAAGRDWTFGWIRLGEQATPAALARELRGTDAEVVGGSGRMVRARLPGDGDRLRGIAALDAVAGVGATPRALKARGFEDADAAGTMPVYVTLMADDPDRRWRRELERLGALVGGHDPELRVYRANADARCVEALAQADFVLSVEPIPLVKAMHDTAVPAMGADTLRAHAGAPGLFVGTDGASVPVGVADTGLNIRHPDISTHRDSICGANFADASLDAPGGRAVEDDDLWVDSNGHGTHVTGTIAGNGAVEQRFAGMAPGVRHIRFAKVLNTRGSGGDSVRRGMEFLARETGCDDSERVKPLIVNMSLSATARIFEGRDVGARKLDAVVWSHRQIYVVAQSNSTINGFSNYGAAKNALAVGAAMDDGSLASFSSHGPTFDGRLAPNVVGTGVRVRSAQGDGSRSGYLSLGGTSMSSPAVAGVAALLMDAAPGHRERPALTRARLMASAVRPDPWLAEGGGFSLDNTAGPGPVQARFGMGKVSARTAVLDRDREDGWRSGSATAELADGEYAWHDIEVPAGASRLDVVMTWDEPPADAVASTVLNDLDLWLDRDGDCGSAACGERSSRSRIDNVEWIVVRNPEPGTYRAKVAAHRVYTEAPRAALAWTVVRGASTPALSLESDRRRIVGEGEHEVVLTLRADGYVAAGTRLHLDCRARGASPCTDSVAIEAVTVSRQDGIDIDLEDEATRPEPDGFEASDDPVPLGASVPVGEVGAGDRREIVVRLAVADAPDTDATLHFTASAWNARADSVAVGVGSGSADDLRRPANDDFAEADTIRGDEGSAALDLLPATTEPGEPAAAPREGRPAGSVWYRWTAPSDGAYRFRVPVLAGGDEGDGDIARHDRVHVFEGDAVTALREVAVGLWGATFFAEEGRSYVVRAGHSARGARMELRWSPAARPANDDFADAAVLSGMSGTVEGSSAGATLEAGESFGSLAATTWFRWTAPEDGAWRFECPGKNVLVFEGDAPGGLRLVSGSPASGALFPAGADREYHVAVAEDDAYGPGGDYALRWREVPHRYWGNDSFAEAEPVDGASANQEVQVYGRSTVEPGEPAETGVRTRWWVWRAPMDARYTWRLGDLGEQRAPSFPKLRVTLWRGSEPAELSLAAEMGPGPPYAAVLDAVGGETYRIAAGLHQGDHVAYEPYSAPRGRLEWGATPGNDEPSGAAAVSGTSGSLSGSTTFATGGRGERGDVLGRSTLWWTYAAQESGWVRFAVDGDGGPWVLIVHRESADGTGGLDVVVSSLPEEVEDGLAEVLFEAEEGVRYTISLGVTGGGPGGDFTLRWDPAEAPTLLHFVGRLADGGLDSRGGPVEVRRPAALAVHASGTALYLASEIGLQVFARDAASGALHQVQLLDTGPHLQHARLLWDATRERLLLDDCGTWRSFAASGDGLELEDVGALAVADDPGTCGLDLLMDADGSDLYRIGTEGMEHFVVQDDGAVAFAEQVDGSAIAAAVLSGSGQRIYAMTKHRLLVFARDRESGALTERVALEDSFYSSRWTGYPAPDRVPLAISDDDAYLFAFGGFGEIVHLYSLDDPTEPDRLDMLEYVETASGEYCRFADARGEAVDVFCDGRAFTAKWDPQAGELSGTGALALPATEHVDLTATPDGRHLYLATARQGVLVFSRDAPSPAGASGAPELVVQRAWASRTDPAAGSTFRLSALVRNRGTGRSSGATLRFHRSVGATISATDPEVGSVPLGVLDASATRSRSVDVVAPSTPGTSYYGACIDDVGSTVANGCSPAVAVSVTAAEPGAPDLVVEDAAASDAEVEPGGAFTLSVAVRNRGDARSPATELRHYRSRNATVSSGDAEVGTDPVEALAPGANAARSIMLTAPSEPGAWWYGACVDRVPDESDTGNNCSGGAGVQVRRDTHDHGDTTSDATPVAVPSTTVGALEGGGDRDYFRVEIAAAATLKIETTGNADTFGTLWDGTGLPLETDDDSGVGLNFRIERAVAAGTYYVEVRGFEPSTEGPYTLHVRAEG